MDERRVCHTFTPGSCQVQTHVMYSWFTEQLSLCRWGFGPLLKGESLLKCYSSRSSATFSQQVSAIDLLEEVKKYLMPSLTCCAVFLAWRWNTLWLFVGLLSLLQLFWFSRDVVGLNRFKKKKKKIQNQISRGRDFLTFSLSYEWNFKNTGSCNSNHATQ